MTLNLMYVFRGKRQSTNHGYERFVAMVMCRDAPKC